MSPTEQFQYDMEHPGWWRSTYKEEAPLVKNANISYINRTAGIFANAAINDLSAVYHGGVNLVLHPGAILGNAYDAFMGVANNPLSSAESLFNKGVAAEHALVNNFNAAAKNGTLPEFISASAGHLAVLSATVLTDTEALDGAEAATEITADAAAAAKLGDSISITGQISAEDANASFIEWESKPYLAGSQVQQFTTSEELRFVRFVTPSNSPEGQWLALESDIAGMTPKEIQQHLALPEVPTGIVHVTVPAGTNMQLGIVGPQPAFLNAPGKGIQYQLLQRIPSASFGPVGPIKW